VKVKYKVVQERHLQKGAKRRWNWRVYVGTRLVADGVKSTYSEASARARKIKKKYERKEKKK